MFTAQQHQKRNLSFQGLHPSNSYHIIIRIIIIIIIITDHRFGKEGFGAPTGNPKPCRSCSQHNNIKNLALGFKPFNPQSPIIPSSSASASSSSSSPWGLWSLWALWRLSGFWGFCNFWGFRFYGFCMSEIPQRIQRKYPDQGAPSLRHQGTPGLRHQGAPG